MILQCPSCDTKYNFPEDKYKEGRKVKCTICGHVFPLPAQRPPQPEPEPEPEEDAFQESLEEDGLDSLFDDDEAAPQPEEKPAPEREEPGAGEESGEPEPKEDDSASVQEEFALDGASGKGFDLDAMVAGEAEKTKGKRSKLAMVMGLVALLVVGGLAYYFLPLFMGGEEPEEEQPAETEQVITTEQIKNFALEDVKQYYVDNEKIGKLFVVQGKVVNNFTVPKELVKIEANLFDSSGASVVSKTMLIGNTVSLFQLQMLSKDELEATINNKVGILTANTNVPPGGEVPFVVVFYNPPDTVQEFGIKVVSAKDPPKE